MNRFISLICKNYLKQKTDRSIRPIGQISCPMYEKKDYSAFASDFSSAIASGLASSFSTSSLSPEGAVSLSG